MSEAAGERPDRQTPPRVGGGEGARRSVSGVKEDPRKNIKNKIILSRLLNHLPLAGLEPATYALEERRSVLLSYRGVFCVYLPVKRVLLPYCGNVAFLDLSSLIRASTLI